MSRHAVVGGGAWGTALAWILARNGHEVVLWALEPDVVAAINDTHENGRFLPGVSLGPSLRATGSLDDALRDAGQITVTVPSQHLRSVLADAHASIAVGTVVSVASKGIEHESLALMSDVASACLPGARVVALSGPSFAAEVAREQPTAIVAAALDPAAAAAVQGAFSNSHFRVYTHDDVIGVEVGGALKNVMAVATGIAEGAGLGFNARAALITRGLAEMTRLGVALGAHASTFAGLAGMGDLVLTCTGSLSRNRAVGEAVGRGATLAEALAGKDTVAEGVATTRSAHALAAREDVEMPIVSAVQRILFNGHPAELALRELMQRELRAERDA